jgi:hypothetical protein
VCEYSDILVVFRNQEGGKKYDNKGQLLQISADQNQFVQGRIYIINSICLMLPNCPYEHCVTDVNVKEGNDMGR